MPPYEPVRDMGALKDMVAERLEEYSQEPGNAHMDLVLFRDALNHICRCAQRLGCRPGMGRKFACCLGLGTGLVLCRAAGAVQGSGAVQGRGCCAGPQVLCRAAGAVQGRRCCAGQWCCGPGAVQGRWCCAGPLVLCRAAGAPHLQDLGAGLVRLRDARIIVAVQGGARLRSGSGIFTVLMMLFGEHIGGSVHIGAQTCCCSRALPSICRMASWDALGGPLAFRHNGCAVAALL